MGGATAGTYFQGTIDELRIYDRALTASEIQADMNTPLGSASADTQPPSAPATLSALASSGTTVDLGWSAATDNVAVTVYHVERCQGAGCTSFAEIATTSSTTYQDVGLTANTSYRYQVRAADAAGNLGPYSPVADVTTPEPDALPPTAPGTLAAAAANGGQVNLTWGAATDNVGVTGYLVERCQGSGCATFVQVGTPTGTVFTDTGLTPNTTYDYRVRATDAAGNLGPYSNVAEATTPATPPGLVAAYSFDGGSGTTVADVSGNGNVGAIVGATWTTAGRYGNALSFNGCDQLRGPGQPGGPAADGQHDVERVGVRDGHAARRRADRGEVGGRRRCGGVAVQDEPRHRAAHLWCRRLG